MLNSMNSFFGNSLINIEGIQKYVFEEKQKTMNLAAFA